VFDYSVSNDLGLAGWKSSPRHHAAAARSVCLDRTRDKQAVAAEIQPDPVPAGIFEEDRLKVSSFSEEKEAKRL
jgi:hypothetical protein